MPLRVSGHLGQGLLRPGLDVPQEEGASPDLGVLAGALISQYVSPKLLSWLAGFGFIAVGIWTLAQAGAVE